jgi:hypothetical protein
MSSPAEASSVSTSRAGANAVTTWMASEPDAEVKCAQYEEDLVFACAQESVEISAVNLGSGDVCGQPVVPPSRINVVHSTSTSGDKTRITDRVISRSTQAGMITQQVRG